VRHSLASTVSQAERERDKLIAEASRSLESIVDFCDQLSRKAEQDMETKRDNRAQFKAAKSVHKLAAIVSDMCRSTTVPSKSDSLTLRNFQREMSKVSSETSRTRLELLPQIRPYYIIDMMTLGGNIDKLRRLGEELHGFLVGRGTVLRLLEDLEERMRSLERLAAAKEEASSQRESLEQQLADSRRVGESLKAEMEQTRQDPKMKEFIQIDSELRDLRLELLRTGFSRLGRPLRKLISLSERGEFPLPNDVKESTKEYVTKPFATFLEEEEGYPRLKQVMSALSKAVSSGKLALKQRESKKVLERTEQVTEGSSLTDLHARSKKLKQVYDRYRADQATASLVQRFREIRMKGLANRSLQQELTKDLERAAENERRLEDQMAQMAHEVEAFASKLAGRTVKFRLD